MMVKPWFPVKIPVNQSVEFCVMTYVHMVSPGASIPSVTCVHWGEGQFLQEAKLLNIVSQTSLELKLWNCKNWPETTGQSNPKEVSHDSMNESFKR